MVSKALLLICVESFDSICVCHDWRCNLVIMSGSNLLVAIVSSLAHISPLTHLLSHWHKLYDNLIGYCCLMLSPQGRHIFIMIIC